MIAYMREVLYLAFFLILHLYDLREYIIIKKENSALCDLIFTPAVVHSLPHWLTWA